MSHAVGAGWALCGGESGCPVWEVLLASSGQRPGVPTAPSTGGDLATNISSAKAKKLASRPWVGLALPLELFSPDFFLLLLFSLYRVSDQKAEATETAGD